MENYKQKDVKNPVFEEELKQILDNVWKNRTNLDYNMLSLLNKISNKKYGCPLK